MNKSPTKQQRTKNTHFTLISNTNCTRSKSSMGSSSLKNSNAQHRQYSHTNSPVAVSASALPAVPLFYSDTYADPPECSLLPKPPESWYLNASDENVLIEVEKKPKEKIPRKSHHKNSNRGFYKTCHSAGNYGKLPQHYISVKG